MSLIAACAPTGADAAPDGAMRVLESARQEGAGSGQIALLEDGDVSYDEYETAMNRAFECMRDAGLAVSVAGTQRQNGTTVIKYTVQGTTAGTDLAGAAGKSLQDDCYLTEARFVDMYWQTQSPDALAWASRRAAALEPLLRECLVTDGADVSADASFEELINAASDRTQLNSTSDCMGEIGYSTWDG
ncbi:hypothetical protein [Cellulomonas phragmiteti]|uniref:Lipoprotein n=1 Tax=Cellulomonas phragmiteti TaxID=478780 RepID=A0ABQ4DR02_9CELL|nr:hypothetical protein [Cellulomonas phragmiteti]GIG41346.1 hypothetical protein Cph01nite_31080 [Cellulomonas phragmiteti]